MLMNINENVKKSKLLNAFISATTKQGKMQKILYCC